MCGTELRRRSARRRRGMSLAVVAFFALLAGAFAVLAVGTTMSNYTATRSRLETQRAFHVADGGLDFVLSHLALDHYWAASDTTEFPDVQADGSFLGRWRTLGKNAG